MFKFFRKIRFNLLENAQSAKYLKYALGEILLVVIGILIALQVNVWREQSNNAKIEQNYLSGILNDIDQDIIKLSEIIESDLKEFDAFTTVLKGFTDNDIKNSPAFVLALGETYSSHFFAGNSVVFEDMKSSGRINLIISDSLRYSILEYYTESQRVLDSEAINSEVIMQLKNEAFVDNIDMNSLIERFMLPSNWQSEINGLEFSFFESDLNNPEVAAFANRISLLKGILLTHYGRHLELKELAESLREDIIEYLDPSNLKDEIVIPKMLLDAIQQGDTESLSELIPAESLNTCYYYISEFKNLIAISIFEDSFESLKYLVEAGANLEIVCENKTALMYAAKYNKFEMVRYLLESGAKLNKVSIKGKTALAYSIQYENPEIETYLRAQGAK